MRAFNEIKRSRFKMATYTIAFLSTLSLLCLVLMYKKPELDLATIITTSVAGILTVATMYIGSDGYRPSEKNEQ